MPQDQPSLSASLPGARCGRWRGLLAYGGVDRAVGYVVATRMWQMAAGLGTLWLIASRFSPEVQGYYYTFYSLIALQSFVELGFYIVIINFASHEWSDLRLEADGAVSGAAPALGRLRALLRLIMRWYAAASVLFAVGVGAAGAYFLGQSPDVGVDWQRPWAAVVAVTSLQLCLLPLISLLEGCNQVVAINRQRFFRSVAAVAAAWATILSGGGLWTSAAFLGANLLCDAWLVAAPYRRFFTSLLAAPRPARELDWRGEIWPMQWRLAALGVVNFFYFSLFNPVIFRYFGAAAAGRMGMTLQITGAIQMVAMAWITPRVPKYGMLIAKHDFAGLDRFWLRTSAASMVIILLGGAAVMALHVGVDAVLPRYADRVLEPLPAALLVWAAVVMQVSQCESAYLRAHKREALVVLGVASGLGAGTLIWLLGKSYGPIGAAGAYAGVLTLSVAVQTYYWFKLRALWHHPGLDLSRR